MPGTLMRAIAIMLPGMFLSQPPTHRTPSMSCAFAARLGAGVAGIHGRVAAGHADDRLVEIAIAEADGTQHCTVGRARDTLGDEPRAPVRRRGRLLQVLLGHERLHGSRTVRGGDDSSRARRRSNTIAVAL